MYSFLLTAILISSMGLTLGQERKVSLIVNPDCVAPCSNATILVHVTGDGENDTIHHIWDFTNKPSIFVAVTPLNTNLSIDWNRFLWDGGAGSVSFSTVPSYMFSLVFDKIIEFTDYNDTGEMGNSSESHIKKLDTNYFDWTIKKIDVDAGHKYASVEIEGKNESYKNSNDSLGKVTFKIKNFGTKDHASMLPHLFHTTNASQVTIALDNFPTSSPNSRFALRLAVISTDNKTITPVVRKRQSINDEHSPGVFTISELITPKNDGHPLGGYLQWRSVAYTSSDNAMTDTTDVSDYSVVPLLPLEINRTVIYSVYGYKLLDMSVNSFNVSFGTSGDGFYKKANYVSWTLLCGLGQPAEEEFSLLAVLVLAIGLGLPALLIIIGIFCLVGRHFSRKSDELFLSH